MNSTSASMSSGWYDLLLKKNEIPFDRFSSNAGGGHLAKPGDANKPGKLTLKPRYVTGENGVDQLTGFKASYWPWQMRPLWKGLILTLRGTEDLPPIRNLSDPGTEDAWSNDLENEDFSNLVDTLQDENLIDPRSNTKKDYKRLEALFPVPGEQGALVVDVVRIVLLQRATANGQPLVLVTFGMLGDDIVLEQNGGGSGPPH